MTDEFVVGFNLHVDIDTVARSPSVFAIAIFHLWTRRKKWKKAILLHFQRKNAIIEWKKMPRLRKRFVFRLLERRKFCKIEQSTISDCEGEIKGRIFLSFNFFPSTVFCDKMLRTFYFMSSFNVAITGKPFTTPWLIIQRLNWKEIISTSSANQPHRHPEKKLLLRSKMKTSKMTKTSRRAANELHLN